MKSVHKVLRVPVHRRVIVHNEVSVFQGESVYGRIHLDHGCVVVDAVIVDGRKLAEDDLHAGAPCQLRHGFQVGCQLIGEVRQAIDDVVGATNNHDSRVPLTQHLRAETPQHLRSYLARDAEIVNRHRPVVHNRSPHKGSRTVQALAETRRRGSCGAGAGHRKVEELPRAPVRHAYACASYTRRRRRKDHRHGAAGTRRKHSGTGAAGCEILGVSSDQRDREGGRACSRVGDGEGLRG